MADIVNSDGWSNILTGLGRRGRDKRKSLQADWQRLSRYEVESIYAVDDAAEKYVDDIVDESFRKDVIFTHKNDDGTFNKEMHDFLSTISFFPKVLRAAKQGRLYGGAIILFGARDGQDPDEELNFDRLNSIDWFEVIHRWDLNAMSIQNDVSKKGYNDPMLYAFIDGARSESGTVSSMIHHSRTVRFNGAYLPTELYEANNYFHDSVLTRFLNPLQNWNSAYDSVSALLQDFAAGVFKMKGLAKLVGSGQDDAVMKRLSLIDTKRSLVKSIVVDADEEFKREATPLSGIKDVLERMDNRLVSASRMPHTRILGEGSSGNLSGSGDSEEKNWHDYVRVKQKNEYKPALMECLRILLRAKNNPVTKGKFPEGFDISFPPVKEMNDKEKSEIYKNTAQGDQVYIQNQVLDPDEIAISRFADGEFNVNTKIDLDIRENRLKGNSPDEGIEANNSNPNNNGGAGRNDEWKKDVIKKRGSKWVILSEEGKELGEFSTKKAAQERLKEIEFFKRQDANGGS